MSNFNFSMLALIAGGFLLGWLVGGIWRRAAVHRMAVDLAVHRKLHDEREHQLDLSETALTKSEADASQLRAAVDTARVRLQQQQVAHRQHIDVLENRNHELRAQVEGISARVFADNSKRMTQLNESNLQQLLTPLREQLSEFRHRVEDVYDKEKHDRTLLQAEIGRLKVLNERISTDAVNLTNALRGDNKTLGSWGELILERVLESAGLQKGREYDREVTFENADGQKLRPDALLYLPGGKSIVIDSKASIKFYEQTQHDSTDEQTKKLLLRDHVRALRKHIDTLSAKRYDQLEDVNSLNFVLMFVPVEAALQAALEFDQKLYKEAFNGNVVLVGPASLIVTCRTIQNVWHAELRNDNAALIARKAGELIDKFSGFVTEIDQLSAALGQAVDSCDRARRKLTTGRGNLVDRAKKLQELGADS